MLEQVKCRLNKKREKVKGNYPFVVKFTEIMIK